MDRCLKKKGSGYRVESKTVLGVFVEEGGRRLWKWKHEWKHEAKKTPSSP